MKLLLASGGIDSTVLMHFLARRDEVAGQKGQVVVMFCDYGQSNVERSMDLLHYHTGLLGLELVQEKIDWPDYARGRGFLFEKGKYPRPTTDPFATLKMDADEYQDFLDNEMDFLQGRNMIFLTRAGMYAVARGMQDVYTAFQFDAPTWECHGWKDWTGLGVDAAPGFVRAFNQLVVDGGFSKPLTIRAPFLDSRKTKSEIVALGRQLGVDFEKTCSCEFEPACNNCFQCLVRAEAMKVIS